MSRCPQTFRGDDRVTSGGRTFSFFQAAGGPDFHTPTFKFHSARPFRAFKKQVDHQKQHEAPKLCDQVGFDPLKFEVESKKPERAPCFAFRALVGTGALETRTRRGVRTAEGS